MELRKAVVVTLVAGMLVIAAGGCAQTEPRVQKGSDQQPFATVQQGESMAATTAKASLPVAKVGDKVIQEGEALTVVSVKPFTPANEYFDEVPEDKVAYNVEVVIENVSDEQIPYNVFDFRARDAEGNTDDAGMHNFSPDDAGVLLNSGDINLGEKVRGHLVIVTPKGGGDLTLIWEPSWLNKSARVDLGVSS